MANKTLFSSYRGTSQAPADTVNEAGGAAYQRDDASALATFAATGCLNGTFYATAREQLDRVLALCQRVEPELIARTALYARCEAHMKDLPALLAAVLTVRSPILFERIFDRVIDTPKMLRNFVQIMRSGAVGRKSLGSLPKRAILRWIDARSDEQLFRASVGRSPSLADIVKMVHPKPRSREREATLGYLIGREVDPSALPRLIRDFEAYKTAQDRRVLETPDLPFQMLAGLELHDQEWKSIARSAPWHLTRMNLNTFLRHGVFNDSSIAKIVADRIRNRELIRRSRVFPYQLMASYVHADPAMPAEIREALQDAMEIATENIPRIDGKIWVFPDISGSMHTPVTGQRGGATSAVRCIDIAALVAASVLRTNGSAGVIPFEAKAIPPETVGLNPRDSVATNAAKLASLPCGGTNCSAPLAYLNRRKAEGDLVIYVSDSESWVDTPWHGHWGGGPTRTLKEWSEFKARNPGAKMICIDIQPYSTTQVKERDDIINVAGFSDRVFELIGAVGRGEAGAGHWVKTIEGQAL